MAIKFLIRFGKNPKKPLFGRQQRHICGCSPSCVSITCPVKTAYRLYTKCFNERCETVSCKNGIKIIKLAGNTQLVTENSK